MRTHLPLSIVKQIVAALTIALLSGIANAKPAVFWSSDPIRAGEAAMLTGEDLSSNASVEVVRLTDSLATLPATSEFSWPGSGTTIALDQAGSQSLKFRLPANWKNGVYAYKVSVGVDSVVGLLNRPQVWWAQGNLGTNSSPGGWIRLFGKNLGWGNLFPSAVASVNLRSSQVNINLQVVSDMYSARVELPPSLPIGSYQIALNNGAGGDFAWSIPLTFSVAQPVAWPSIVYNVRDFGATGNGTNDDTAAIKSAIAKATLNKGGIVFFPAGSYAVSSALTLPAQTVLRGENRETVCLAWPDFVNPPFSLIQGCNSFGLEQLTLYAGNHQNIIVGDLGNKPQSGNVFIRSLRVRANSYRGDISVEEVDRRFRASPNNLSGGNIIRLGGPNVEITNCDLYGSGMALYLSQVTGGRVSGNQFFNGRWGWYSIADSDGCIFENNTIQGADMLSAGGGINCDGYTVFSQNVYFASNCFSYIHGWDREAMTSDAGGMAYYGSNNLFNDASITLGGPPDLRNKSWFGAGVFVLQGRGAGQYRRLVGIDGQTAIIDRPFDVIPDLSSQIVISLMQYHYLILGNTFEDTGAAQISAAGTECIMAENQGTRMQGYMLRGNWYGKGYNPNWYCQLLDNKILEGNYYHWSNAVDAQIQVVGGKYPPYIGPLTYGDVLRRNKLENNASIRIWGTCRDVLADQNVVFESQTGIQVDSVCVNTLAAQNNYVNVASPVQFSGNIQDTSPLLAAKAATDNLSNRLLACWNCNFNINDAYIDSTTNRFQAHVAGFVQPSNTGVSGNAVAFNGNGYLHVNEFDRFNLPNLTVSFWFQPKLLQGRYGLVVKGFSMVNPLAFGIFQFEDHIAMQYATTSGKFPLIQASVPLKVNEWVHVAAVFQRSGTNALFLNGKLVGQVLDTGDRAANGDSLVIGRSPSGGNPSSSATPGMLTGLMDEIRIWDRALSASEIMSDLTSQGILPPDKLSRVIKR